MELPDGLHLPVIMQRENPCDAFVSNTYSSMDELPVYAVVGTCSLRRQTQLLTRYPHLKANDLRGNIKTRLGKLDNGEYDAIILAAAGLIRMGFGERMTTILTPEQSLPSVGQGALGIECRSDDERVNELLQPLKHDETDVRVRAERAMNTRLNGGCQVPIAGYAELDGEALRLRGLIGYPDGSALYRCEKSGGANDPESLGIAVAEDLLAQGGGKVLAALGINYQL